MDHLQFFKHLQNDPLLLSEEQWRSARTSAKQAMEQRRNKFVRVFKDLSELERTSEFDRTSYALCACLFGFLVFFLLAALPKSLVTFGEASMGGIAAMVAGAGVYLALEHKFDQVRRVLELTQPISEIESDICEEALRLCGESRQAAGVRDAVVAAGAALRVFHFLEMRKLHQADTDQAAKAVEAERRQLACRELHGVPQ